MEGACFSYNFGIYLVTFSKALTTGRVKAMSHRRFRINQIIKARET